MTDSARRAALYGAVGFLAGLLVYRALVLWEWRREAAWFEAKWR